jgi:small subunit ribosomal protein S1
LAAFADTRGSVGMADSDHDELSPNDDMENETESFADLLDAYGAGQDHHLQVGDKVRGKIISVGKESLFIDTGAKIDGVVEKVELLDDEGNLPYSMGDEIELYVVVAGEGEIRLSKAVSGIGGLNLLHEAYETGIPVEGKVVEPCKGGLHIEVAKRRAFCPISQIDVKYVEDAGEYVGQTFEFLITQLEDNGRNIVVSRRKILDAEIQKAKKEFFANLDMEAVIEGRVSKIMPYGAFIELAPGVEGMAHISEMSWSRTQKPEDLMKEGDPVTVKILDVTENPKGGGPKISLSMKQLTGDPWREVASEFKVGDKVRGTVTRCAPFGAFVEITPGVEGLVHLSEMSYAKRVVKAEDVVQPGEAVTVLIKEIDEEKRRVSLSIKDAEGDPWAGAEEKYLLGKAVSGVLEKKEAFGYFIQLAPGITGLMPKSKLSQSADTRALEKLKEGDTLTVVVEAIDSRNRKMTLTPGDMNGETDWQKFSGGANDSMGLLGEKLKAALRSKDD